VIVNNLKVVEGVERSLQGSQRRNAVPPPTIEEEHPMILNLQIDSSIPIIRLQPHLE